MPRDEFDVPGNYVQIKDLMGELVLFTPYEHVENISTANGDKDAVLCDIVVLSQEGQPEYTDSLVFQGALIAALKKRLKTEDSMDRDPVTGVVTEYVTTTSRRVLGVIGKGDAKKGQNAPFILEPATPEHVEIARKYSAENPTPAPVKRKVRQYVIGGATGNIETMTPATGPSAAFQAAAQSAPAVVAPDEDPFAVS